MLWGCHISVGTSEVVCGRDITSAEFMRISECVIRFTALNTDEGDGERSATGGYLEEGCVDQATQ
jgi:hypothetical protein